MLRSKNLLSLAALATLLTVTGCNVLDGIYDEGGSVANLVEDAEHARANQDYDRAVELLGEALEADPGNPVVRVELSSTLMQREKINLLSLEQITSHVIDGIENMEGGARSFGSDSCTWNSSEPTSPFDPRDVEGYDDIIASSPVLGEVLGLLNDGASSAEPPVIPGTIGELNVCTAIDDGVVVYDRDGVLAEMRAHFDGDYRRVNAALTMNAVAHTLNSYVNLFENEAFPVAWYIVGEDDDTRLGFCLDRDLVDPFYANVEDQLDAVSEALFSLDLLIYNGGDEEMQEYVADALEFYETFEESIGRFCTN